MKSLELVLEHQKIGGHVMNLWFSVPWDIPLVHLYSSTLVSKNKLDSKDWWSHSGLLFHRELPSNSNEEAPQKGTSAGLSLPGQWFQWASGTNLRISVTLFCTNCFQSFSTTLIQYKVTLESVKQIGFCSWCSGLNATSTLLRIRV